MGETTVTVIPKVFFSSSGTNAARPSAAGLANGSFYYETDTLDICQVQGGAWVVIFDFSAIPAALAFTELVGGQNKTCASDDTWLDWDLSAIIPAGAKYALISVRCNNPTTQYSGVRKNGTALVRLVDNVSDSDSCVAVLTEVDANRIIEIYKKVGVTHFNVLGYWI